MTCEKENKTKQEQLKKNPSKKLPKTPTKPDYESLTVMHKLLLETGKTCFHLECWSKA